MDPQGPQESQVALGMMGYLVFQAQRDPRGCLASRVFRGREESLARMDTLAQRENSERGVGLASRESAERKASKEQEDLQDMKEKWILFLKGGNLGKLDCLEMLDSQEREVIKAILGCRGGEESQEATDHLDFTEGSQGEMGSQVLLDPQALQAHLG